MVDSTQQLVRNPPRAMVVMPLLRRMKSRFVLAKVSRPRLPSMTMSPSAGASSSMMAAPQVPLTNTPPSTTPLSIPYGCLPSSLYPSAQVMGACMTVAPAARAASTTRAVLASMSVFSMTGRTASCRPPPSDVKSFWYSMSTTAVVFGSNFKASSWSAVDRRRHCRRSRSEYPPPLARTRVHPRILRRSGPGAALPRVELQGSLVRRGEGQHGFLHRRVVLQLALYPAQRHGHFMFRVVALQVDGGDEVQLARSDKLQVQVREPGNLPVFQHPAGHRPFDVRGDALAHQEAPVAVDQHDGDDGQQNADDDRAHGIRHRRARDLVKEYAGKRDDQADQGRGVLREHGSQGGIGADQDLFQRVPFQLVRRLPGLAERLREGDPLEDESGGQDHVGHREVGGRLRGDELLAAVHDGDHRAGGEESEGRNHRPHVGFPAVAHGVALVPRPGGPPFGEEQEHLVPGVRPGVRGLCRHRGGPGEERGHRFCRGHEEIRRERDDHRQQGRAGLLFLLRLRHWPTVSNRRAPAGSGCSNPAKCRRPLVVCWHRQKLRGLICTAPSSRPTCCAGWRRSTTNHGCKWRPAPRRKPCSTSRASRRPARHRRPPRPRGCGSSHRGRPSAPSTTRKPPRNSRACCCARKANPPPVIRPRMRPTTAWATRTGCMRRRSAGTRLTATACPWTPRCTSASATTTRSGTASRWSSATVTARSSTASRRPSA